MPANALEHGHDMSMVLTSAWLLTHEFRLVGVLLRLGLVARAVECRRWAGRLVGKPSLQ